MYNLYLIFFQNSTPSLVQFRYNVLFLFDYLHPCLYRLPFSHPTLVSLVSFCPSKTMIPPTLRALPSPPLFLPLPIPCFSRGAYIFYVSGFVYIIMQWFEFVCSDLWSTPPPLPPPPPPLPFVPPYICSPVIQPLQVCLVFLIFPWHFNVTNDF